VVGEAKAKINSTKAQKMRNGTKKHKNATEYDKKKNKNSTKIHMTAVDMVICEPYRTRAFGENKYKMQTCF